MILMKSISQTRRHQPLSEFQYRSIKQFEKLKKIFESSISEIFIYCKNDVNILLRHSVYELYICMYTTKYGKMLLN